MNQRPMTPQELVCSMAARRTCEALDRAERIAKLGHAQQWRAAELIARYVISRARNGELS